MNEFAHPIEMTDFSRSYVAWTIPHDPNDRRTPGHQPWGNSARIQIDARCQVQDVRSGMVEEFYLIAPCRKEWMYNDGDLIQRPGGEYRVIFSADRQRFVGRDRTEAGPREASCSTNVFDELDFRLSFHHSATELQTDQDIIAATLDLLPLNCWTRMFDANKQLVVTIEYPIRTMNIHPERERFQVDTGPIIYPDLSKMTEPWIEHLHLAHVVFNQLDRAEFVIAQPTPIDAGQPDGPMVYDYSRLESHTVEHRFAAAGLTSQRATGPR